MGIFTVQCPWGEATKLSSLLHCLSLAQTPPHTNHNQSLHMIGRISQSREGKERRKERRGHTKIQLETNLRRVKCHAGYSLAKASTIMYSLMEAQLSWYCYIAFPLFFIFHWIKHGLFPQASGLQVFIQLNGFAHKLCWKLRFRPKLSSLQYLSASIPHFDTHTHKREPAVQSSLVLNYLDHFTYKVRYHKKESSQCI